MSEASTLLNSLAGAAYSAGMGASEEHIVVGRDRFIKVPDALKKIAVQFDHNVETVTFDCPRYWDDTDFSTLRVYINYTRADGYEDSVVCDNVTAEEDTIHFQWTVSSNVTQVAGTLSFLICMKQVDSDGNESQHWNSEINSEMYISKGMETQESVLAKNPDLVTHMLNRLDEMEEIENGSY